MANTVQHKHRAINPSTPTPRSDDVDGANWLEEHKLNAPEIGAVLAGDPSQSDGASWIGTGLFGHVLTAKGPGTMPVWQAPVFEIIPLQAGDLIRGRLSDGVSERLPIGTESQILSVSSGMPVWRTIVPMPGVTGDILWYQAPNVLATRAIGANGQVLTVVGGVPIWSTPAPSFANPMIALGDLIKGGASGVAQRLSIGINGQMLTVVAGEPAWAPAPVGFVNPMTALGDVIIGGPSGAAQRLAIGGEDYILTSVGGVPTWTPRLIPDGVAGALIVYTATPRTLGVILPGAAGQILTMTGGVPTWVTGSGGGGGTPLPINQPGDLVVGDSAGLAARLGVGSAGQVLTAIATGGKLQWQTPSPGFANPMIGLGDLIYGLSGGNPTRLAPGSNGQFLTLAAGVPVWQPLPVDPGFANPMTTLGDVIYGGAAGVPTRLAIGSNGAVLKVVSGIPIWDVDLGFVNPMTTQWDLIIGGAAGVATRLGMGAAGTVLTSKAGGTVAWDASTPSFPILAPDGSVSAPSYSFAGGTTAGMWRVGATLFLATGFAVVLSSGATTLWTFNNTVLSPGADLTQDLGDTTHRLNTLWLGTDVDYTALASGPATPAAGHVITYAKTDKKMYQKDDAGLETPLGGGSGKAPLPLPLEQANLPDGTGTGNNPPEIVREVSTGTQTANTPKRTRTFAKFDAATDEHLEWGRSLPSDYVSGGTLRCKVKAATASAGNMMWKAGIQVTTDGSTADSAAVFNAADLSAAVAAPGTLGQTVEFTIALTMTGALANREFTVFIGRDADHASDTMAGDAVLMSARLEYA